MSYIGPKEFARLAQTFRDSGTKHTKGTQKETQRNRRDAINAARRSRKQRSAGLRPAATSPARETPHCVLHCLPACCGSQSRAPKSSRRARKLDYCSAESTGGSFLCVHRVSAVEIRPEEFAQMNKALTPAARRNKLKLGYEVLNSTTGSGKALRSALPLGVKGI